MLKIEWSHTIPALHMGARLGQHFLVNKEKLRNIADAISIQEYETIIEIGPGHGELTHELVSRIQDLESKIVLIEKDKILAKELQKRFENNRKIKIIEGDVLKILPHFFTFYSLNSKFYKIVGNIPYYITGKLLHIIGELSYKPISVTLTIQREVAERVCAETPHNNLLAASVAWWAISRIVGYIPKEDFSPPPKIESAILHLATKKLSAKEILYTPAYYKCIKTLFRHPRKTILNNFCEGMHFTKEDGTQKLAAHNIRPHDRPQNLTFIQYKTLAQIFSPKLRGL